MNNQMPYGFMPGFGGNQNQSCHCTNQIKTINDRIENLERQIRRLDRRVSNLENSNNFMRPIPVSNNNDDQFQNNYMI